MRIPIFVLLMLAGVPAVAEEFVVKTRSIEDRKAVIATVEPARRLVARARIGGIIAELLTREGQAVEAGAALAVVVDEKLGLQLRGLDARIRSQEAARDQARTDYERAQELMRRGVGTQSQLDATRTAAEIAERILTAIKADRDVVARQAEEGSVPAPAAGRVLTVPVVEGGVVMPGETIATVAVDGYILRLDLPERHARFMKAGDPVTIGGRASPEAREIDRSGTVRIVYPEIQGGRVVADVEVADLGGYFVGERLRVSVSTGRRDTIVIPRDFLFRRGGTDLVRLKSGIDVPVQPGPQAGPGEIEVLAGLRDGDILVRP
jgi:multidrug efflux system membrane fusion protein